MNDKVSVQAVTFGAMNFAMQQNYVPLVRSVTIKNNSDEEIKDIMLKISFEPEFAKPFTHRIEVLPPHTEIEVSPVLTDRENCCTDQRTAFMRRRRTCKCR